MTAVTVSRGNLRSISYNLFSHLLAFFRHSSCRDLCWYNVCIVGKKKDALSGIYYLCVCGAKIRVLKRENERASEIEYVSG